MIVGATEDGYTALQVAGLIGYVRVPVFCVERAALDAGAERIEPSR